MPLPPPELVTCPDGHVFTTVRVGDAEPVCPACQVRPAYGRAIGRLAGVAFGEAEYVRSLEMLDAAMNGNTID